MTAAEFENTMKEIALNPDEESSHGDADKLMMTVLRRLGYGRGVEIFEAMPKWYA